MRLRCAIRRRRLIFFASRFATLAADTLAYAYAVLPMIVLMLAAFIFARISMLSPLLLPCH